MIDVWFDSGSMPFAQYHAPLENEAHFEERFPADFICEALDQTRGWFYSLIAVSTLLFDRSSYRNVVCLGLILDANGRKMSTRLGNTVKPYDVIDRFGADALRWYFFTSKQPWDGYNFSLEAVGESLRLFLLQLWNTYSFYVLYANATPEKRAGGADRARPLDPLTAADDRANRARADGRLRRDDGRPRDRGVRRRPVELVRAPVQAGLLGRRRARVRDAQGVPRDGREAARAACPFVADEIYDNLDGTEPSVHLCDFPDRTGRSGTKRSRSRWRSPGRRCASVSRRAHRRS